MESGVVVHQRTGFYVRKAGGGEGCVQRAVTFGGKLSQGHGRGAEWDLNIEGLREVEKAAEVLTRSMWGCILKSTL